MPKKHANPLHLVIDVAVIDRVSNFHFLGSKFERSSFFLIHLL